MAGEAGKVSEEREEEEEFKMEDFRMKSKQTGGQERREKCGAGVAVEAVSGFQSTESQPQCAKPLTSRACLSPDRGKGKPRNPGLAGWRGEGGGRAILLYGQQKGGPEVN